MGRLYVERIEGRQAGPVLIFLHHGLGSVAQWRDFPMRLGKATGLPVLLYDRCGHGLSDRCGGKRTIWYMHREAEVLGEVLASHGVSDFILIGHSDGGSIALLYAAMPGVLQPRGIVSESAHVFVEDITRQGIRAAADAFTAGMRHRLSRYHGLHTERLFWDWAGTWLSPSFDTWNLCEAIRKVRCPVLALQGSEDEYGTPAQIEAIVSSVGGPVSRHMIPSCGHEPHHQHPEQTLAIMEEAVRSFLAR